MTTVTDQRSYVIGGLPAGDYNVIAYQASGMHQARGYTKAVPCGLLASCRDHGLLPVVVHDGQSVTNVQPNDWYTTGLPPEPHGSCRARLSAGNLVRTEVKKRRIHVSKPLAARRDLEFNVKAERKF